MTDEYTPSMDDLREAYAHDPEAEYRDPVNYGSSVAWAKRAFDRALAAYTVEVQANTLREAASELPDAVGGSGFERASRQAWLRARADSLHPEEGK